MLRVGVLVSGGGTNLQAILDAIDAGTIRNAKVEVVISNNAGAFALERAKSMGFRLSVFPRRILRPGRSSMRPWLLKSIPMSWTSSCWQDIS